MSRNRTLALVLATLVGAAACADTLSGPPATLQPGSASMAKNQGTGLVLKGLTNIPVIGDVVIDQVNLTHLTLVEDVVGNIVGLQLNGVVQLTGGVLGTTIVSQDVTTQLHVASSGPGQCDVLTVELAPITVDVLGRAVAVDIPAASVNPKASGAVGSLLCALGSALQPGVNGATGAVRGLVNAINRLLL
jgi:hypothetical protein